MTSADIAEEIKDLQSNVALSLLNELKSKNVITAEMYLSPFLSHFSSAEIFRGKFVKLHDLIVQSFSNHKSLHGRAKRLKTVSSIPAFLTFLGNRKRKSKI